jgi:RHS repeat-associated protein
VVSFSYALNQANQRTTNTLADGGKWSYQYDELGQVTSGKKYFSDGTAVQGAQFEYDFDTIGNRATAQEGTATAESTYTANNLNQYSQRTVADEILVTGSAVTGATVSVRLNTNNAALANRHAEYFWKSVDADNSSAAFFTTNLKVTAYIASGTTSLVRTETRTAIVPQTPEAFTWDADGNLLTDSLWTNSWDANNRMVLTESRAAVPDAFKKRLSFQYDYMGRRTVKQAESGYSGGAYSTTNTTTYVWDGFNIVAEICNRQSVITTNFYTWAIDASGTLGGAGGVGGLAILSLNGTNCLPIFNGNGDVMGLVTTSGTIVAEYEYSPVGVLLKCSGPLAKANPFRFSTKPTDDENGVVPFQKRDYRPDLARFTSQDPLGQDAGPNPYILLGNQAISQVDYLGLWTIDAKSGRAYAVVRRESRGDTVKDLAKKMGLDDFDVLEWARKDSSGTRFDDRFQIELDACELYVPNRILVMLPARDDSKLWSFVPVPVVSPITRKINMNKLRDRLAEAGRKYEASGFHVLTMDFDIGKKDLVSEASLKWPTYGFLVGGHGTGGLLLDVLNWYYDTNLRGGDIDVGPKTLTADIFLAAREYRYGAVTAFACWASEGAWARLGANEDTHVAPDRVVTLLDFPNVSPQRRF